MENLYEYQKDRYKLAETEKLFKLWNAIGNHKDVTFCHRSLWFESTLRNDAAKFFENGNDISIHILERFVFKKWAFLLFIMI